MRILGLVMRIFSFAFHLFLGLVMMAISFIAWSGGQHTLQIGYLPWKGPALTYWLFFGGLAGIIITVLAIKRVLQPLFLLWSLAVLVILVRGVFFTAFHFGSSATSVSAGLGDLAVSPPVLLVIAALLAVLGSIDVLRRRPEALRRRTAVA